VSTSRLESFSDGVIAVAITLLVLDLAVPDPGRTHHLAHALGTRWPSYGAYATSFITIGIIWMNHHVMISRLRETDRLILILNLILLLTIGLLPFATHLFASYLNKGHGQHLAAAIYAGAFLVMSLAFSALNFHILLRKDHLMHTKLPDHERRRILARSIRGLLPYTIATALAIVSQYVTFAICVAIAVYYALPIASGGVPSALDADSPVG
jgi:TMEM175 potassium channel family protein